MKTKKETIKSLPDFEAVKSTVEIMKISGAPFTVSVANKSTSINGCLNFRFIEEEKSVEFFVASSQLKKEVRKFLEKNQVRQARPEYFGVKEVKTFVLPEVYNIDLTAAYLYVLKNLEIISNGLFDKLLNLPKIDRLASIGTLASKKLIFSYDQNGDLKEEAQIIEDKELSNVFYLCVEEVNLLMNICRDLLGDDFIFYWVDGIYFKNKNQLDLLHKHLEGLGYPAKAEILKNFLYFNNPASEFIEIEYLKYNKLLALTPKKIIIPKKQGTFNEDMYTYLNSK